MKKVRMFCPKCREYVDVIPVERLPTTIHDGEKVEGTIWKHFIRFYEHKWTTYDSLYGGTKPDKLKPNPKIIKCPRCGEMGRVNSQRRYLMNKAGDQTKPQWNNDDRYIRYIVTHEKLRGNWGHRVAKRRRCCITSQEDRDYVLKIVGRYLPHKLASTAK
jgi:phage FluMu protein Com